MTGLTTELRDLVDDALLLKRSEQRARSYSDAQHLAIRSCVTSGARRIDAAAGLRDADQLGSAYTLYRDAALLLGQALLVAERSGVDAADAPSESALTEAWRARPGVEPYLPALQAAVSPESPLAFDRLEMDEAAQRIAALARALEWMQQELEPRTVREIRRTRVVRIALAVLLPLLTLAVVGYWTMHVSNVALRKNVTSAALGFNSLPIGAVDGNKDGSFGFHTTGLEAPWLVIDLDSTYRISEIKVFGRGDCCFDQSIPLHLAVSTDGVEYQRVETRATPFSESDPWVLRLGGRRVRYVRLEREAAGYLVLSEVEVYGR